MRVTLADKLKEAFAKAGQELPASKPEHRSLQKKSEPAKKHRTHAPALLPIDKSTQLPTTKRPERKRKPGSNVVKTPQTSPGSLWGEIPWPQAKSSKRMIKNDDFDLSVYRLGVNGKGAVALRAAPSLRYQLTLAAGSAPNWVSVNEEQAPLLLEFELSGQQLQPASPKVSASRADRELVLGLDFGSSCVKVVIGDSALEKAFAVPFRNAVGLPSFLLPCRLYENRAVYSLEPIGTPLADLKLSLLAEPNNAVFRYRVVAFLALIIRRARAWLFSKQEAIYRTSNILWRMALGLPSANHLNPEHAEVFRLLGMAAWVLAGSEEIEINDSLIAISLQRAEALVSGLQPKAHEDVVLSVIPEIAAQIYGYVASENFDRQKANIFMMVDVGAGTVDASLFHVKPARGKWDFEFFTATVEPRGTMNLHRNRLGWWKEAIQEHYSQRTDILLAISTAMHVTDIQSSLPERLEDYVSAMELSFEDSKQNPDNLFYEGVFAQLGNRTYWEAHNQGNLRPEDLTGIPLYLCGGGTRSLFYDKLGASMKNHRSFTTWMGAERRQLEKPKSLNAPGLARADYDRLSVAYGLSFLNVGKVLKAIPKTKVPVVVSDSWRDNYTDK
jgi:hypothetical protein